MKTQHAGVLILGCLCTLCVCQLQLRAEDSYLPVGGATETCYFVAVANSKFPETHPATLECVQTNGDSFAPATDSPISVSPSDGLEVGETGHLPASGSVTVTSDATKTGYAKIEITFPKDNTAAGPSVWITVDQWVVFDVYPIVVPEDIFDGRSYDRFGLGEVVDLSPFISPSGVTAAQIGGLRWEINSPATGGGTLSDLDNDGLGTYTAPAPATDLAVTLRLCGQGGASAGLVWDSAITIVPPTGVVQVTQSTGNYAPTYVGVWLAAASYLRPTDVSFTNLEITEGACNVVTTGAFAVAPWTTYTHPKWPARAAVSDGDATTGCRVEGPNAARAGRSPVPYDFLSSGNIPLNFGAGTFQWTIPWQYTVGTATDVTFTHLVQLHTTTGVDHKCTISKGSISHTHQF